MAVSFASPIDLQKLELLNARIQNLASAPAAPVEGQIYQNTADHNLYLWDGSAWVDLTSQGVTYSAGTGLTLTGTVLAADFGSGAGKVTQGNDARLSDSRAPNGSASGDLTGSYPAPTIGALKVTAAKIANGTITDTEVAAGNKDGAAGTASMRTLGTGATQAAAGNDSRLSDSRSPSGSAGGDLAGSYPNPTIGNTKVTMAKLAADTKDQAAGTSSLRKIGSGATDAAAGNHAHAIGDITGATAALNLKADLASPTFTGTVTVPNGAVAGAAVNLGQLQAVQEGTKGKSARVVSTVNVNVSSPGASHGGKSLSNGDILLLTAQTTASQNGPYRYNGASSALTRDPAADTWAELVGARWLIEEGTSKGTRWYSGAEAGGTIGTTALSIIPAPGVDDLIAGYGLTKTGNQLEVEFGDMEPLGLGGVSLMGTSLVGPDLIVAGAGNGVWFNPSAELTGVKNGTAADSAATVGQATSLAGRTIKGNVTAGLETTVTHSWGTRDVQVEVFRNSGSYDTILCEVQRTSTNAVKLVFGTAATAGQYRYVIREIA